MLYSQPAPELEFTFAQRSDVRVCILMRFHCYTAYTRPLHPNVKESIASLAEIFTMLWDIEPHKNVMLMAARDAKRPANWQAI